MVENTSSWKKDVVLFIASQVISLFGTSLVQYAIMWHITLTTQSGIMMTISIICGVLPTFFLSPFAGVWADRYNRKTLIILSDSMIAVATLVLAILFFMGHDALWLLFLASALRAFGSAVQTPAVGAFLPQLVPEAQLTKVNAANTSIQSFVSLVSPMVSGALLTVAPIESIFLIDVITAAIAVSILMLFVNVPIHKKAAEKQEVSYFADMREGFHYVRKHGFVKTTFLFLAIIYVLIAPLAFLTPLHVTRKFGDDVWRLTAIEVIYSAGIMIGGLIMASWGGFKNKTHTMVLSIIVLGACTIALSFAPLFALYLLGMGVVGLALPAFNTPAIVLLQEKVDGNFLGRVFGVLSMIASSTTPLAMLVFGPLADLVRIEWLLLGTGLLLLAEGLLMLGSKVLIEAGRTVPHGRGSAGV
jgi:DHA3 family macrolide efflux protein-like MFS transporter